MFVAVYDWYECMSMVFYNGFCQQGSSVCIYNVTISRNIMIYHRILIWTIRFVLLYTGTMWVVETYNRRRFSVQYRQTDNICATQNTENSPAGKNTKWEKLVTNNLKASSLWSIKCRIAAISKSLNLSNTCDKIYDEFAVQSNCQIFSWCVLCILDFIH